MRLISSPRGRVVLQRPVRGRAHQDFQQLGIDAGAARRRGGRIVRWRAHRAGWSLFCWPIYSTPRGLLRRLSIGPLGGVSRGLAEGAHFQEGDQQLGARRVLSAASRSACFSAGPNGRTIDSEVTRLASAACFTASQSVEQVAAAEEGGQRRPSGARGRARSASSAWSRSARIGREHRGDAAVAAVAPARARARCRSGRRRSAPAAGGRPRSR